MIPEIREVAKLALKATRGIAPEAIAAEGNAAKNLLNMTIVDLLPPRERISAIEKLRDGVKHAADLADIMPSHRHMEILKRQAAIYERNILETGDLDRILPVERLTMAKNEFHQLIGELAEGIKSRRWTSVIGEDVSGRIPARVAGNVMRDWSLDRQLQPPGVFFITGRRASRTTSAYIGNAIDLIAKNEDKLGRRLLYVTDTICSGGTLRTMGEIFQARNIAFDVAVLFDDSRNATKLAGLTGLSKDVRWYGGGDAQWGQGPLYALKSFHPLLRAAIGVEKFGNEPIARATNINPTAVRQLRSAVGSLSRELYRTHVGAP